MYNDIDLFSYFSIRS